MPPDEPERSELDEALFSSTELDHTPTRGARPHEPDEDLSKLDAELFGEFGQGAAGDAAEIPPDGPRRRGRSRRFGLGLLVVLLVVGLGGLAYAAFGRDADSPTKAKVEVRGSEVTRTTLRTTTTSSTTTTTSTTTTSTTAPPATTRAPVVVPETDPPATDPPVTDPPPTDPPPTQPPPTDPTTTTVTTTT